MGLGLMSDSLATDNAPIKTEFATISKIAKMQMAYAFPVAYILLDGGVIIFDRLNHPHKINAPKAFVTSASTLVS